MAFRLPPLNTLRFFEASGRRLSFKLAAEELDVTPSAVSHGVQSLEDWLGVALFTRTSRGLQLTDAGTEYLPSVREALTVLANASDRVPGRPPQATLTISVAPTFGTRILLPRLPAFRSANPGVSVQIDTSHRQVEFPRDGVDVAIRRGKGDVPDLATFPLFPESLVPVCSPGLLERLGPGASLCDAPLIRVTSVSEDWTEWARAAGKEHIDCERALLVDTIQLALDAAAQGLGIALGRLPLASRDLESGRLVRFCGPVIPAENGYWLVTSQDAMARPEIVAFKDWLVAETRHFRGETDRSRSDRIAELVEGLATSDR